MHQELWEDWEEWSKLGQNLRPLIEEIGFDKIVIDMLHMLLRIGDRLFALLFHELLESDHFLQQFESLILLPIVIL